MTYKTILSILILITFSFVQVGCAPLLALPIFVLALPFQIIKIVIGLIPIAIKYAPLALLFVRNNENDTRITELQKVVDQLNDGRDTCEIKMSVLSDSITLCTLSFKPNNADQEPLISLIHTIIENDNDSCILFANADLADLPADKHLEIWQQMRKNNIKIGQDNRVIIPYSGDDISIG
jgi:hypothetical protein